MGLLPAAPAPLLRLAAAALLLGACAPGGPAADAPDDATPVPSAVDAPAGPLDDAGLTIAPEGAREGYDRDLFGDWATQPDGCSTRERVLLDEATEAPQVGDGCAVGPGRWESSYDGVEVDDPGDLDIDHLVPLAEAWDSGADGWDDGRRRAFANDLDTPDALIAVTAESNRAKGDRDPAEWRPPDTSTWCDYATAWIEVKREWGLTVDVAEAAELAEMLDTCPG